MPRRNTRAAKPRRHTRSEHYNHAAVPKTTKRPGARVPIEHLVLPVGKCGRKLMFRESDAPKALRQAREKRIADGSAVIEQRWYRCDRCGHAHLTSRERYDERSTS